MDSPMQVATAGAPGMDPSSHHFRTSARIGSRADVDKVIRAKGDHNNNLPLTRLAWICSRQ